MRPRLLPLLLPLPLLWLLLLERLKVLKLLEERRKPGGE
jgi:hypothetical protein